jgi:hypothetical protein
MPATIRTAGAREHSNGQVSGPGTLAVQCSHHELHDRPGQGQSLRSYTHHRHHRQLTIVYFGHSETGNDTRHDMTRH